MPCALTARRRTGGQDNDDVRQRERAFEERDDLRISAASARKSATQLARRARWRCRRLCRRRMYCESKQDESTRSGGLRVLRRALFVFVILAPGLRRAADFAPRRWAVLRSARQLLLGSVIRPRRLSEGVAPVFQGGSSVLTRRFALRISSTSRGLLFSSTLHKADIRSAFSGASAIVAARPRGNNGPCVQSHCPSNPHSAHRPICEQPRGSCEVCLEL